MQDCTGPSNKWSLKASSAREWDHSVVPARRVFSLTETGAACLDRWVRTLERYRDAIDELLDQMPTCRQEN